MRDVLGATTGRPFRGNLHCHSTGSDGGRTPAQLVAAYRAAGYDFLVITDHFEERYGWPVTDARADAAADGLTIILGAELSAASWDDPAVLWIGAAGLPPDFAPPDPDDHAEAIARAAGHGAFLSLLHPGLNHLQPADVAGRAVLDHVHAVEVYTHQSAIYRPGTEVAATFLDALLDAGHRLTAVAGDDAHFRSVPDGFGAWVEVFAAGRGEEELLAALKAGTYYSTQGPAFLALGLEGDALHVACTSATSLVVSGPARFWRRGRWRVAEPGGPPITEAVFDVAAYRGTFCRLTAVDAAGRQAWSNPIWV